MGTHRHIYRTFVDHRDEYFPTPFAGNSDGFIKYVWRFIVVTSKSSIVAAPRRRTIPITAYAVVTVSSVVGTIHNMTVKKDTTFILYYTDKPIRLMRGFNVGRT